MSQYDSSAPLSDLALRLLSEMAKAPQRIEYNTRVLGGSFRDADVERLDKAYEELAAQKLVEKAGAVVSFFGKPKALHKVTEEGLRRGGGAAA